jgi:hypothetical protein
MKRPRGRPTLLTPELQKSLCDVLAAGNYIDAACGYAGIHVSTYHDWVNRGEAELERRQSAHVKEGTAQWEREQPFVDFSEACKKARAQAEVSSVARIRKAGGDGQWQADAWFLERSMPAKWGRRVVEHQGKDGNEMVFKVVYGTDGKTT